MGNSTNQCYNCRYLDRFFTKGIKHFDQTKLGWCFQKKEIVNIHDNCDNYIYKPKRKRVNSLILYNLSGLLTEISEIRKMLETEINEINEE